MFALRELFSLLDFFFYYNYFLSIYILGLTKRVILEHFIRHFYTFNSFFGSNIKFSVIYLSFLVGKRGNDVNLNKIQTIIYMNSPSNLIEVECLTDCIEALSSFLNPLIDVWPSSKL